jgi:CDGSH-type Zn-finger protein
MSSDTQPASRDSVPGSIRVVKNGSYVVSGGIPLSVQVIGIDAVGESYEWREGRRFPPRETYSLCRCGHSRTMPFCDGSHAAAHFDGTETASRLPYLAQARRLSGPDLDLTDARVFCAAARFCDRAGGIWRLIGRSDEPDARALAEKEASCCPSGRLVVWDKDGKPVEPIFEPSIVVIEDPQEGNEGPLWVRGGIPVFASDGFRYEVRNRVALCRCGKSENKPFCDGSHCLT